MHGVDGRRYDFFGRECQTTPNLIVAQHVHLEVRDDAEVVRAAFERPEQVGMLVLILLRKGDAAVREHDLVRDDVVTCQTSPRIQKGHATSEEEASNSHTCFTAASDGIVMLFQLGIDVTPSTTGANVNCFSGSVDGDVVEQAEIDLYKQVSANLYTKRMDLLLYGNSSRNIARSSPSHVPATANGKLLARSHEGFQCHRDFLCGTRSDYTGWPKLGIVGPV